MDEEYVEFPAELHNCNERLSQHNTGHNVRFVNGSFTTVEGASFEHD